MTVDGKCERTAVFHSKLILSTSEKYDLPLPPLTNHQIAVIKLGIAGNLIYISVRYHKNIAKAFFAIIANQNWRICFFLAIILQYMTSIKSIWPIQDILTPGQAVNMVISPWLPRQLHPHGSYLDKFTRGKILVNADLISVWHSANKNRTRCWEPQATHWSIVGATGYALERCFRHGRWSSIFIIHLILILHVECSSCVQ